MSIPKSGSIIIVGAGTFGISTAYHLCHRGYSNIRCLDAQAVPSSDAAGNDLNKIVRPEYEDPIYTKMALDALEEWRSDYWKEVYHETGRLATSVEERGFESLKAACQTVQDLGFADDISIVETHDDIVQHCPQLRAASGIASWKGLYNPRAGWVHSQRAMVKWATEAQKLGVEFISGLDGKMIALEMNEEDEGEISGVRVASGKLYKADQYIICAGAASAGLLPDILAATIWAKAWVVAHIQVPEKQRAQFIGMPVIDSLEMGYAFEPDENGILKVCDGSPGYDRRSGVHTDPATGANVTYSIPRYDSMNTCQRVPKESLDGIRHFLEAALPQIAEETLVDARLCWDADTYDGHFLIDWHPKLHRKVLIATGGSCHAFKMFPILGRYVVDALEDKASGLRREWRLTGRTQIENSRVNKGDRPEGLVKDLLDVELVKTPSTSHDAENRGQT